MDFDFIVSMGRANFNDLEKVVQLKYGDLVNFFIPEMLGYCWSWQGFVCSLCLEFVGDSIWI